MGHFEGAGMGAAHFRADRRVTLFSRIQVAGDVLRQSVGVEGQPE
jgi:hypothetical protein